MEISKIYEGDPNKVSNNVGLPHGHVLSPNFLLVLGLGYIQSSWPGVPWKSPNKPVKTIGCSPQTDSKAPLPKTALTQLIEHGEVKLVPI